MYVGPNPERHPGYKEILIKAKCNEQLEEETKAAASKADLVASNVAIQQVKKLEEKVRLKKKQEQEKLQFVQKK